MEAGSSWRVRIAAPHIPHVPYVFTYSIFKVHKPTCVGGQKSFCLFWIKSFLDLSAQKAHKHSPSAMNGSVKIMCFSGMTSFIIPVYRDRIYVKSAQGLLYACPLLLRIFLQRKYRPEHLQDGISQNKKDVWIVITTPSIHLPICYFKIFKSWISSCGSRPAVSDSLLSNCWKPLSW